MVTVMVVAGRCVRPMARWGAVALALYPPAVWNAVSVVWDTTFVACGTTAALVLLTRRYSAEQLGRDPRLRFVQPSRPIPIAKWDYTRPDLLQETYDLGRRDGERFDPGET